jgi:DNA-binding NarL/FixJ family response regulator
MIRVLIADDQALIRAGFRMLLESADDIVVVGEATDGAQAAEMVSTTHPDVVLMDIRMPNVDGIEATRRIASNEDLADVRVLILTTFEADEYVYEGLRAGASGFLVKDTDPGELLRAVRVIAGGDSLLSPGITRRLIADVVRRPTPGADNGNHRVEALTQREREVLTLVGTGLSNDEIAKNLFLSPLTVKTHVSRMLTKIGARDRAQLVVTAYESGLVTPGTP